jgi:hypothetical protein
MSYASDRKKLDNLTTDNDNISKSRVPKLSTSFSTPELSTANRLLGRRPTNFNVNNVNAINDNILLEADNQVNHPSDVTTTAGDIPGNIVCRFYQQGYCQRGERCFYSHTHTFNNGLGQAVASQMVGFQGVAYYGQYGLPGMGGGGGGNILPSTSGYNYNQNLAINPNLNNNMRLMHNVPLSKMNQKRMSGDLEGSKLNNELKNALKHAN